MPDIVRDHASITERLSTISAKAREGLASRSDLVLLAAAETENEAFMRICIGHRPHCLMSTGLLWGDEIRHPAAPGLAAKVRLGDQVEMLGETMSITTATGRVAAEAGRGVAVADWEGCGVRLGDALGLEHPPRARAVQTDAGSNYQLL
jgi:hypothetical protein